MGRNEECMYANATQKIQRCSIEGAKDPEASQRQTKNSAQKHRKPQPQARQHHPPWYPCQLMQGVERHKSERT